MSSEPIISAIIVSYNTRDVTIRALEALYADVRGYPTEVMVVDNASTDGSVAAIRAQFPSAIVFESPRNLGFGAANNVALARARGKYLFFVNSDAFVHPGCTAGLIEYLETHPKVGVVAPRLDNLDGSLQRSCWRFPTPLRSWAEAFWLPRLLSRHPALDDYRSWGHDSDREVDFVIGACMLARREIYSEIGGFDEQFFMYQEEADWQKRLSAHGRKVRLVPTAQAVHLGGASGKSEAIRVSRQFYESLDRYFLKHHGWWGLCSMRGALIARFLVRIVVWSCWAPFSKDGDHLLSKVRQSFSVLTRQAFARFPR